jgi:tetratricopeptide (TPR) repeat protein
MKFGSLALAVFLATWPMPTPADSSTEHLSKGETLFAAKDFSGAIHEYREAVRLNPRDPKGHFELGLALKSKGDLDEAVSEYREAIRLQPGLAEAHVNVGAILQMKNGAASEYREAIRLKPNLALPHAHLGSILRMEQKSDKASSDGLNRFVEWFDFTDISPLLAFLSRDHR